MGQTGPKTPSATTHSLFTAYLSRKKRADERTRTADLLITSDASGVAGVCTGLQIPHIYRVFFSLPYPVLHRIAFPVVSEWYQTAPIGALFSVTWVSMFLVEQTSARWSREPEKRHQLSCRGRAGTVRPDGGRGGAVPNQMNPRVFCYLCG